MQQHRDIVGACAPNEIGRKSRIGVKQRTAACGRRVERQKPFSAIGRHATRIVVQDGSRPSDPFTQLQQFVDLLLVLGNRDAWFAVPRVGGEFIRRNVGKNRRGKGAKRHSGERGGVETGAVVADDRECLTGAKTQFLERSRERENLGENVGPVSLLPHAAVALPERGTLAGLCCVARQRRNQRRRPAVIRDRPRRNERKALRHVHDAASARRAAARWPR